MAGPGCLRRFVKRTGEKELPAALWKIRGSLLKKLGKTFMFGDSTSI
jgi:hypothetical protein